MSNERIYYRCGFDMKIEQDKDFFSYLQRKVRKWISSQIKKQGGDDTTIGAPWFFTGDTRYLENNIVLKSSNCDKNGRHLWAFEISQPDKTLQWRKWITQISIFQDRPNLLNFQLQNSFIIHSDYLGKSLEEPDYSVPNLVKQILVDKKCNPFSGQFPFSNLPIELKLGDGLRFQEHVEGDGKSSPYILITPLLDSGNFLIDPVDLAQRLQGSAQVFFIRNDKDVIDELKFMLKRRFFVYDGAVRVYFPDVNCKAQNAYKRHRYITKTDFGTFGEQDIIRQITESIIRKNIFVNQFRPISINDVISYRTRERITELREAHTQNEQNDKELLKLFEDDNKKLYDENIKLKTENENYEHEIEEIKNRNIILESKLKRKNIAEKQASHESLACFGAAPQTVLDIFQWFSSLFPQKLDLTERAKREMRNATLNKSQFRDFIKIWNALVAMKDFLLPLALREITSNNPVLDFRNRYGIELALSEGSQTNSDPKFQAARIDTYKDVQIDVTPHVKIDDSNNRFYYQYVPKYKIIVIGYYGHLNTYGTRRNAKP